MTDACVMQATTRVMPWQDGHVTLLMEVKTEADQVTLAASALPASASAAAALSQHVTTAVMDISHGAAIQLDALNAAGDAVRLLAEAGASIGEAAEDTSSAGHDIRATASATREQVQKALDVLTAARHTVLEPQQEMTGRRDATGVVDDFVSVISEIATQTNPLALNAVLEAARAGSAGGGFAEVAQEVAASTEETSASAEEVSATAEMLQMGSARLRSLVSGFRT
jgi:methyl-accepting chemotaxis protein